MDAASMPATEVLQSCPGFSIRPLSPALGAEVRGLDLSGPMPREVLRAVRQLLYENCVLLVPGQSLDEAQQVRFGECFGTLAATLGNYASLQKSHPAVMYVTNEKEDGRYVGALPDGEMYFHSDRCYVERPCLCTMLYGIDIPSQGGDTCFASQYEAYDALPEDVKRRIDGLRAVHAYEPGYDSQNAVMLTRVTPSAGALTAAHPMVITHPATGRKALYVNRLMTAYIVGMPRDESAELLEWLFDHQEQSQFVYAHKWTPGDVVIWDNRCVTHARTDFHAGEARKLRRVVVETEDPL
jgi:taurine dioxygenase